MNDYSHQFLNEIACTKTLGKIVCVGRNYADHAKELNNPIPDQPLLFIKPSTAAVDMRQPITIPKDRGRCHHEVEMSVLIGRRVSNASSADAKNENVDVKTASPGPMSSAINASIRASVPFATPIE